MKNNSIYLALSQIPPGSVVGYKHLGELASIPNGARVVASALKGLPDDTTLPWHRVVSASRKIAFPIGSPAYERQKRLLQNEGIIFESGKIPKKFFILT